MRKRLDLLKWEVRPLFFHYLFPSILSMLAVSAYIFFDTAFIGVGGGSLALAALNISLPVYSLFTAIHETIGIGGGTTLSIEIGQGNFEQKNKVFSTAIMLSLCIGFFITIVGIIFINQLSMFLGATKEILPLVKSYLIVIISISWAFLLVGVLSAFVRNDKNPKLVMVASLLSNAANLVLDYVFIFIFHWGIFGAALATAVAPIIDLCILSVHFRRAESTIKFKFSSIDFTLVKRILRNGFGNFILDISAGVVIFILNNVFMKLGGEIYVAAYGVVANIASLTLAIFSGVGQSIQPIISVNFGANKIKRVIEGVKYGIITAMSIGLGIYIILSLFPIPIISLFTTGDKELISITSKGIKIYFIAFTLTGANMVFLYFLQSIEKTKSAIIISLSKGILFTVLGVSILTPLFGINGVWFTISFSETLTFIISLIVFIKVRKELLGKEILNEELLREEV